MRHDGSARHGANYCDDASDIERQSLGDRQNISLQEGLAHNSDQAVVTVVISKGESCNAVGVTLEPAGKSSEAVHSTVGDAADDMSMPLKKAQPSRNTSSSEECRVCQQEKDENLIDLGCQCRGGLSKAHKSCINTWFRTIGSNKCEICQKIAVNVAPPESHPDTSYWVWMVDPAFRGSTIAQERGRGCFSPLWVAFSILIGGLLLDVLISITLGVSALPVNIIIGVIVVLGLGTALRLALEFCREWSVRRVVHRVEANVHLGYHSTL